VSTMVYELTFAVLRSHLVARTRPTPRETTALADFCARGVAR
jgi:hypothetical protein